MTTFTDITDEDRLREDLLKFDKTIQGKEYRFAIELSHILFKETIQKLNNKIIKVCISDNFDPRFIRKMVLVQMGGMCFINSKPSKEALTNYMNQILSSIAKIEKLESKNNG